MEKHGIDTDASIPTHINNIIERQYVTVVDPGRQWCPLHSVSHLSRGTAQ
jgi:DNA topoisomerase-3